MAKRKPPKKSPKKSPTSNPKSNSLVSKPLPISRAQPDPPIASVMSLGPGISSDPVNLAGPVEIGDSVLQSPASPSLIDDQLTVSPIVLEVDSIRVAPSVTTPSPEVDDVPVKVVLPTEPVVTATEATNSAVDQVLISQTNVAASAVNKNSYKHEQIASTDNWVNQVKGFSKPLQKKGTAFTLDSGEACVKIPNSVIERNKKSWECFVLGQFYSEPPSQGTIHNIVNGIWSKQFRDIAVSKMEGSSFLFRIPNHFTRNRVLNQRLWQIGGQTMFVAKWVPGIIPTKPELTSAPIWLELRNVPLQFFHEEGLERIAGLVGDPKFLHSSTANKTNLEVAKVLTLIDPRKPLPEAVNVQFDSGEIQRILVSSPWMPPVCSHCKEIGHSLRHCKGAPVTCIACLSSTHSPNQCPKLQKDGSKKRRSNQRRRSRTPAKVIVPSQEDAKNCEGSTHVLQKGIELPGKVWAVKAVAPQPAGKRDKSSGSLVAQSEGVFLGTTKLLTGESSSGAQVSSAVVSAGSAGSIDSEQSLDSDSDVNDDSSDILSHDSEGEAFIKVLSRRQRRNLRGKGLNPFA